MDLTAEQFEDLVGAYALDACDPDEAAAVERYAAHNAGAAREIERLREAAAGLGAAGALRPPVALRDRLLDRSAERVAPVAADDALRQETDRFDALLQTLSDSDLQRVTHNGLNVHELVAHVEAIDRAFVDAAADPNSAYIGPNEVEALTAEDLPQHVDESFAATRLRFRWTRETLIELPQRVPAEQRVAGYGRDDSLVVRAFETWVHHDDLCRAIGRDAELPDAAVMRTMTELAMQSLPLAAEVRGVAHPGRTARIVLSGPGGGVWTIQCAAGEQPGTIPDVTLRMSAVDFCRRFADRIDPADLPVTVEGDARIAADLIDAASAFAGL